MSFEQHELDKFAQLANQWWDVDGDLKTLHDINPARLAFIKQHSDLTDKKIIDVGCGGGILTEALARCSNQVKGIDRELSAIEAAKLHAEKSSLIIDYHHGAVEEIEEQFDVVTCLEMLEHVPEPDTIIKHCARLLRPGGWCFFSTINRTMKAYMTAVIAAEYLLKLLPRQTHDYKKFIKPSELATSMRRYDLELVSLKGLSYNPLSREAVLTDDVSVNYLVAARRADLN